MFLVDVFSFALLKSFQQILRILSDDKKRSVGIQLGRLAYSVLRERRRVAISNLKKAFGSLSDDEINRCVKKVFENLGVNMIECLSFPYLDQKEYEDRFRLKIEERAQDALRRGGVIALVFHFGNWEIMGVASKLLGREIVALAKPLKGYKFLNGFVNGLRSKTGLTVIPNRETAKEVISLIRAKKIVAILADQREKRSKCVYVDFFGEKAPTSKSIAVIAMRTGAPVIPVYLIRKGFLKYTFVFSNPLEMETEGELNELILENTRKINAFLESLIKDFPEEWFWVHRRWKRKIITE